MTEETAAIRLKRLKMRSWRRGMKEMDLILGPFSDGALQELGQTDLDLYEAMLSENDQELYAWFSGLKVPDKKYSVLIQHIMSKSGVD